jgi:hypothetical protein
MEETIYNSINFSDIQDKDGFYVIYPLNKHAVGSGVVYSQYNYIFTAAYPCELIRCDYIYSVAGGAGGNTFYLQKVTKGTGTNLSNTAMSFSATANTVYTLNDFNILKKSIFKPGESLKINASASDTTLDGLNFTFYFKPIGKGNYR